MIFDLDGVLTDSEPLHHCAVNAVLAEDGHRPLSVAEYLVAAQQLRAQPGRCVVFEDSPAGVTAASRAGMYAIAVCTSYTPPGLVHGAHFTVNSLAEVSRALRGRTVARAARQS